MRIIDADKILSMIGNANGAEEPPKYKYCPNCGADMRETNATKEQREQLDLMRAKAQMNIKPR